MKDVPESFITKVSKEVATLTNKEEAKVMVTVEDNIKISLGSSGKLCFRFPPYCQYHVNCEFMSCCMHEDFKKHVKSWHDVVKNF